MGRIVKFFEKNCSETIRIPGGTGYPRVAIPQAPLSLVTQEEKYYFNQNHKELEY